MNRRLRALGAALLLAFLVVGVPILLIALVGWPLPESIPAFGDVTDRLEQGDIPPGAIVDSIAVVVWLAWLQLAWSVLWETVVNVPRLASNRVWRSPPLVLAPLGDAVARLFSMILAAGVIASATPGSATALTPRDATAVDLGPTAVGVDSFATARDDHTARPVPPRWRVAADDDLWSIVVEALGDGSHVDQIVALNPGLSARNLREGMILDLPSGAVGRATTPPPGAAPSAAAPSPDDSVATPDGTGGSYVVQENDGMWDVAEALLGDGARHVEMSRLAIGQEVAPGIVFDADTAVIHPGWVFTDQPGTNAAAVPADADDIHVVAIGDTLSGIAADELGDQGEWTEIWDENRGADMGGGRTFDDPNLILPGWELELPRAPVERDPATRHDPPPPEQAPAAEDDSDLVPTDPEPHRADVGPTSPEQAPAAEESSDRAPTAEPPDSGSVVTDSESHVEVPTTDPAVPPMPTTTTDTGVTPSGEASADPGRLDRGSPRAPSPVRMEHAALLAAGVLALVGVRRRRALRAALPHARIPAPPSEIARTERRLRMIDAGERSARIDVAARAIAHSIVGTGTAIGTMRVAKDGELLVRLTGDAPLWAPWVGDGASWTLPASVPIEMLSEDARRSGQPCLAFVTVGLDADGRDVLVDLEAAGATIVVAQPDQADGVVRAIGAGLAASLHAETIHLVTSSLGTDFLFDHRNAHQRGSAAAACDAAVDLIGSTWANERTSFDLRSRGTGGEMWEPAVVLLAHADDAGAGIDAGALAEPNRGLAVVAASSITPVADDVVGARMIARADGWTFDAFGERFEITPIGVDDADIHAVVELLEDAARPIAPTRAVDASDHPGAAEPLSPIPHDVVVRMFGGVEVVDAGGNVAAFERSKTVELIAWLATHREASTRTAARTALWELDVRDATFANVVSEARRGLGRLTPPPLGEEWLARTLNESLPLHARVVTDADLIEQRVAHARTAPPAHAVDVLRPAVEMIRGLPFAGTSYLWPDADGIASNLVLLATTAACDLAGHALSMGDTDLVFWATGQGLKVLPGHEELIGYRMRAYARAGDLAGVRNEWESYERAVTADSWSDGEPAPKLLDLRRALLAGRP